MFEHLECANDEEVQYTYEEIVEEANKDRRCLGQPDTPFVPRYTYKDDFGSVPGIRLLNYHFVKKFNCSYSDPNLPVVMKGAWEVIAAKYHSQKAFNEVVRDRFLRFYKATILSPQDAEKWKEKIDTLMHKDVHKRYLYRRTNSEGRRIPRSYLYSHRDKSVWVFGIKYYYLDQEKLALIKAIYRHVRKLTTLTNPNEEKDKWQRLIQQVI